MLYGIKCKRIDKRACLTVVRGRVENQARAVVQFSTDWLILPVAKSLARSRLTERAKTLTYFGSWRTYGIKNKSHKPQPGGDRSNDFNKRRNKRVRIKTYCAATTPRQDAQGRLNPHQECYAFFQQVKNLLKIGRLQWYDYCRNPVKVEGQGAGRLQWYDYCRNPVMVEGQGAGRLQCMLNY
jgi:hypothetical protein